ncbi:LLM class flavin-dependent oxidoreductase [Acidimicrobiaceae bacterium AH-315-P05]|nr:LLM class flavin-dependent oxidoreductase [Acidimicrobiaceae bacterium AH-315-P05]
MRVSISVGSAYYDGEHWDQVVEYVKAADRIGVDSVWSAEAWGMDAVASIGYLAAVTDTVRLGTGIMQVSARTPAMTAMTAMSLAQMSGDRFLLGLGLSGPQVVEGLHGDAFVHPLSRLREYIDIVRMAMNGERIVYEGDRYVLPRPGGEGKALKMAIPPKPELPIYIASLGPKSLELTGAVADGWLGTSFIPEYADIMLGPIAKGAKSVGRSLDDIDIQVSAGIRVSDDVDKLIAQARPAMAFTLGGMGSATTNFYNSAYSRAGFGDIAAEVQRLWVEGDKAAATAAVPDELLLLAYPIGTRDMVLERLRAYKAVGVDCLRLGAVGRNAEEQITHLEMLLDLIADI